MLGSFCAGGVEGRQALLGGTSGDRNGKKKTITHATMFYGTMRRD